MFTNLAMINQLQIPSNPHVPMVSIAQPGAAQIPSGSSGFLKGILGAPPRSLPQEFMLDLMVKHPKYSRQILDLWAGISCGVLGSYLDSKKIFTNYLELPICFCLVYMVLNFWYLSWGAGRWGSHTYQENCFPQPDFYHLDCFPWWFCICCWCGKPNAINHPYVWGSWNWVCPYFSCDVSL